MKKILSALLMLVVMPGLAHAGKIKGTVKVKGLRSPENVLVYLAKAPQVPAADLSKAVYVMDQRNLTFIPHILPVPVGATVQFPNHDEVNHNVFSLSRTKTFNLGNYKPGESGSVVFDKPGIVELRCDIHAEMAAYILVMEGLYWAVTDSEGHFEIPSLEYLGRYGIKGVGDLPPGKYVIKTWHEKLKTGIESVVMPESGDVSIQIELGRGVPGVLYK